jgi:uncharacterized protein YndB with AHSA1/START domain
MSGTLITKGDSPAVRLERLLKDPPRVVWKALTEPEGLAGWFPCKIVVDGGVWRVGAKLEFPFPAEVIEMTLDGEVLAIDEPHALAYTWGGDTLRFELHDHEGGTRLVLINELPRGTAARNAAGWEDCLDRLMGQVPPAGAWRRNFDGYAKSFEPELGPQEGPPAGYKGD